VPKALSVIEGSLSLSAVDVSPDGAVSPSPRLSRRWDYLGKHGDRNTTYNPKGVVADDVP